MAFGVSAIVANAIIIAVFLSTSHFRQQYQMFIALAIGDLINGMAFFLTGFIRTGSRRVEEPATAIDCMFKAGTIPMIVGSQLPALCTLALSIERYLAVSWPFWYRTNWTRTRQQMTIATCFLWAAFAVIVAFLFAAHYGDQVKSPTGTCFISQATGPLYSLAHFALVIIFHVVAFVVNVYALCLGTRKSSNRADADLLRAEATRVRLILIISALSVLLVAIPNTLLLTLVLKVFSGDVYTTLQHNAGYVFVLFSANSAINLAVYLYLSRDFRSRFFGILQVKQLCKGVSTQLSHHHHDDNNVKS